jgi:hypothetical protein
MSKSLEQQIDELRRMVLLMASDIAAFRRALLEAGIEPPPSKFDDGNWLTPTRYAKENNLSYSAVMMRIKRKSKTVEAEQDGSGRWLIKNVQNV